MRDLVLVLEASAGSGSLALLRGSSLVAEARVPMRGHDGERMMPAVVGLLHEAGASTHDLQRVICGGGPGGFTSLRISAAIAKGLAVSLGIELWAASSLALLAAGDAERSHDVLAVLDALRGEWYAQRFHWAPDGTLAPASESRLLDRDAVIDEAAAHQATIVGMGVDALPDARAAVPEARHVVSLPEGALLHLVDLASWEPDYGRLAEAQVKWERAHGRSLDSVG